MSEEKHIRIYPLRCGSIRVSPKMAYGGELGLRGAVEMALCPDRARVELPVFAFLIEHPRGRLLFDCGWCREISPDGRYDVKAVRRILPERLAALYHPTLPKGEAIDERLAALGLQAEDIIVEVDGTSTKGMTTTDVVALIKGEENTDVTLTVYRKGETDYLDITVTRKKVEAPTVSYKMLDSNIAYIQIAQFEDVTGDQFTEQIAKAREDGMKALILDLRNNPGGTLTSVIEVARQLLPKGLIVYTEDKNGERDEYKCDGSYELEVPMVVLVNENSASASEILSGAIKDYGIGTLLGTTTFGKGIVQKVFGITDGSAVKLTISHYYTPNGNDIHGVGIEPDETLDLDVDQYLKNGTDNQLERATEILEGEIVK